jgi:hypothetical protein
MTTKTRAVALLALIAGLGSNGDAHACGCFAPPAADNFAVNQQAEQIIFEVTGTTVSAHVRIFYQGDPEEFAWLLPMPSVPELALSNGLLFGLIEAQTAPVVTTETMNLCPGQRYRCETHDDCPSDDDDEFSSDDDDFSGELVDSGIAFEPGVEAPAVEILARQQIGSYDTITFAADEAEAAVIWLNDNGFVINETMSPYMQPFLDAGMVFIASRLVPGADLDEIRPLRLTYEGPASIPLQLTAIAAEPHMMVTSFIYSDQEFDPAFLPLVDVPSEQINNWRGRSNYPMLLSRTVDEAGGNAFVKEFVGRGPVLPDPSGCCGDDDDDGDGDFCNVGGDGVCQCPEASFDVADCGDEEELTEAATIARQLRNDYAVFTRLSTRVSPEQMTFNSGAGALGWLAALAFVRRRRSR